MASRRRSVPTPSTSAVYSARSNDTWVFGFRCLLFYNFYRNFAIIICFEHFQIITSVRLIEAWPWKQPWHGTERPSCIFLSVWLCWWCARGSCRQSGPRSGGSSSPGKSFVGKKCPQIKRWQQSSIDGSSTAAVENYVWDESSGNFHFHFLLPKNQIITKCIIGIEKWAFDAKWKCIICQNVSFSFSFALEQFFGNSFGRKHILWNVDSISHLWNSLPQKYCSIRCLTPRFSPLYEPLGHDVMMTSA